MSLDLTVPMRPPPRRQLRGRALRGSWPAFPGDHPARVVAVRRASLTAVAEAAERADDQYGAIGRLGLETWQAYVATPWRELLGRGTSNVRHLRAVDPDDP